MPLRKRSRLHRMRYRRVGIMHKWQVYTVLAMVSGAIGVACGASGTSNTSGDSSAAATTSVSSVPDDNIANLDAVMGSAITQNYLTAASKDHKCAADANAVAKIVKTLAAALGDSNATVGAGVNNGNISVTADANSVAVVAVFEQDLPELRTALATLEQCVHASCGGANMPSMPTFPCGKPGSSTFPNHSGNGNVTNSNTTCSSDTHHHPANPSGGTTTAGGTTSTAGTTTATTTAGTTTGTAGTTTAGTTTGTAGTTTAGTTSGGTTTAGATTAGSTAGSTTNGVVTEPNTVLPGINASASSCIGVVLGGRAFVGCGVDGL